MVHFISAITDYSKISREAVQPYCFSRDGADQKGIASNSILSCFPEIAQTLQGNCLSNLDDEFQHNF